MSSSRQLRWPLRAINVVGRGLHRLGIAPKLELDLLLDRARAEAKLDDFGSDRFREPLTAMLEDLRDMGADLNLIGRLGLGRDFQRNLVARLRIKELLRRHPEIREQEILAPIIIVASPRTGTTMLHNMLAELPGVTAPRLWEMLEPVPFDFELPDQPGHVDPARQATAKSLQLESERALPQLAAIHPVNWDWADECLWSLCNSLFSEVYLARVDPPRYRRLVETGDWSWALAEHRELLQILQWQRNHGAHEPMQWILKAPGHTLRMPALMEVFPDARVLRTHRDPRQSIASMCSLTEVGHLAANHRHDLHRVGREVLSTWVDAGLERFAAFELDPAQCFDLDFRRLMTEPFVAVAEAFAHFGLAPPDPQPMQAWLDANPRHGRGKHRYELERYGISEAQALEHTTVYRERFAAWL